MWTIATWKFTTKTWGRIDFVGIAQIIRINSTADELIRCHIGFREHERHIRLLINTDPMLPGNAPTVSHTTAQNLPCQFFSLSFSAFVALIVEHQRMQIAITGVEDVGHAQPIAITQFSNLSQHLGQSSTRDDTILHNVVRADATHSRKGGLASLPHEQSFLFATSRAI